ncbi:MAG: zinc-dependent metalloprotease [Chloroflexota bacterium]
MARYRRLVGAGLLLSVAAGLLWEAGRRYQEVAVPRLIDWDRVKQSAQATLTRTKPDPAWSREEMQGRYSDWVSRSEQLIGEYTGRELPRHLEDVRVLDRPEWVAANVENFQILFQPVEDLYQNMLHEKPFGIHMIGGFNQILLSGQMGLMLGYMAQRVLGQYDLSLLGREVLTAGKLYFVEPNIAMLERRLKLPGDEFRMWIALHETTHAYEFESHPWLREYMNNMLIAYFDTLSHELLGMKDQRNPLQSIISRVTSNLSRTRFALEIVMSPQQRRLFQQLQALMCLVEGFSNHVMDAVGRVQLAGYDTMKERFEARSAKKSPGERIFSRLTGLDVKMEQYRAGEAFVNQAVAMRGLAFVNHVWDSPRNLPTLDEIYHPDQWVARLERVAAA